jgi:tetratricopeptide (TPR) repeat protein
LIIEPDPVIKNAIPTHIEKLTKERKFADAIKAIDAALVKSPRNVQLRFLKARLQIELRDQVSAKNTWIEITQQFPELPEPYNNLAALSANQGKWIEARDYLELALKLRPDYVTAQGNLAEVYLRLSELNYQSASKLQPNQREYGLRAKAIKEILNPVVKPINKPSSVTPKP